MTKGDLKNKIDDCLINSIINIVKDPTIVSKTDQLQGLIFYHITGECWDSCNDNETEQTKGGERYGRTFAPDCDFRVYERCDNIGYRAMIEIGDFYYETDPYTNKQDAIDEQRGCLLSIKEQIEKYLEKLD